MEKYAWKATVIEGKLEEYVKRHDEIWDEMKEVLEKAGIVNYTIWNVGNELFGYYECEKGVEYAAKVQNESEVVDRWNEYMKDVMVMELDPVTGAQPLLKKVFSFKENQHILIKVIEMKIKLNPDKEVVKAIKEGLKKKGGYCPCRLEKTEDNKCMCKEFKDQIADPQFEGYCHCMLYYKEKDQATNF